MTPQLQAALDQLNACETADDVAALLRRHGVRAKGGSDRCRTCPIAVYLCEVGGARAMVELFGAWADGDRIRLQTPVCQFIYGQDTRNAYPDLEAPRFVTA